jgi:uncharacterized protein YjlB
MTTPIIRRFGPEGGIPNSHLPLLLWKGRLAVEDRDGEAACALYRRNGWGGTWVYTVYPFWHFHTRGHEVLGCVAGHARIGFGGDGGMVADIEVGDVAIVPAGVGHRKLEASADFLMAGGYPPGQEGNIVRPGDLDHDDVVAEIQSIPLPDTDPVTGRAGGVAAFWGKG